MEAKFLIAWLLEQITLFLMQGTETQSDLTIIIEPAHVLGGCLHIPDVLCLLQRSTGSEFSPHQRAALNVNGNAEFESFFKHVCSFPHITKLADEEPELSLLPSLSQQVHKLFKDAVYQVVWNNLGDWFPPLEGAHCQHY